LAEALVDSRDRFDRLVAGFKEEGSGACSQRWRSHVEGMTDRTRQILLFGAGQFGTLTLDRLRHAGVEPCCFSDNNQDRWGTTIAGVEVIPPQEAVARYSDSATFIVTIFNGSNVRQQLRQMGCKYVLPATSLFWRYPREFMPDLGIDSPELLTEHEEQIRHCFDLFADESSRKEFCDQIQWRYWFEPEFLALSENPKETYFPEGLVKPISEEVFVDCGAFDGDCIRSILERRRNFEHIYALEPDPKNRRRLQNFLSQKDLMLRDKVTVLPYALADHDGTVFMSGSGDVTSRMTSAESDEAVECKRLDSLEWSYKPTYIKMDIEGAEPDALVGEQGYSVRRCLCLPYVSTIAQSICGRFQL